MAKVGSVSFVCLSRDSCALRAIMAILVGKFYCIVDKRPANRPPKTSVITIMINHIIIMAGIDASVHFMIIAIILPNEMSIFDIVTLVSSILFSPYLCPARKYT